MEKKTRTVALGIDNFSEIIENNYFYVDKTDFIRQWWQAGDKVTLITRPRRFGKTLTMSMLECFFSMKYQGRGDLFEGLSIWEHEKYRELQGSYPVISLSFANIKESTYLSTRKKICQLITKLYAKHSFLLESDLYETDKRYFKRVSEDMDDSDATLALNQLSDFLYRYYGKKVIILLDEYDTPMQEAYVNGFWDELTSFTRGLFNATFKTNPSLERGIMTGITRVSKESIFSDLNNLKVITTTSNKYADTFGFTEKEVFDALDEYNLTEKKDEVKKWYDGFTFGEHREIYNPWSILNFLDTGEIDTYWANTSSNSLAEKLIKEGNPDVKMSFEELLRGNPVKHPVDEQIVYNQLSNNPNAIWSLLLAGGYLKVISYENMEEIAIEDNPLYTLTLTNLEVQKMFLVMVREWFNQVKPEYNHFVKSLLNGDEYSMNKYMKEITLDTFSYFDTGSGRRKARPEKFYHGFVLGLLVDLKDRYMVTSNRESGYGRYDVMLEPRNPEKDDAIILEFKAIDTDKESSLKETLQAALKQIREKQYARTLIAKGIPEDKIHSYGIVFKGKDVLIGS